MGGKSKSNLLTARAAKTQQNLTQTRETKMKTGHEAAAKHMETTLNTAAAQLEKCACAGKSNMDAMAQCSTIMAKGFEEMSKNMMGWMQSAMEQSMATGKQMLAVKTLREMVDLQTEFMRGFMDNSVAETTKLGEISARVANQAIAPISARVNEFVETMASNQNKAA
ncbi:MAG: phasin family protein [Alphaproteobacteria bacterium]